MKPEELPINLGYPNCDLKSGDLVQYHNDICLVLIYEPLFDVFKFSALVYCKGMVYNALTGLLRKLES